MFYSHYYFIKICMILTARTRVVSKAEENNLPHYSAV
jgi:hypothetical protein